MSSLKKNFAYSITYQILLVVLPLITAPYISRVLGPDGLGEYSYTHSVAYYFILMAMLGINQHGNRSIAETQDNMEQRRQVFWCIYIIQIVTNITMIVIYSIYLWIAIGKTSVIPYIQMLYVISGLFDISWLFFGMEKFKITVLRNAAIKFTTVILIFIFVRSEMHVWRYTLIMAAGTLISQLYLLLYIKKFVPYKKVSLNNIIIHIKPVLILFLPNLAYSIYKVVDKIMLGAMTNYSQVGYYENAYKINNVFIGFITAIGNVMLPRTTALLSAGRRKESIEYIRKTFLYVNVVAAPLVFGIAAISQEFTYWYYGPGYEPCVPLMNCLNWTIFFVAWANIMRTQYLIPNKRDKVYVISTLIGALVNLMLNAILIPKMQGLGAAIGTFFAEFTVMIIQAICINNEIKIYGFIVLEWPYYLAGGVMFFLVRAIGCFGANGFIDLFLEIVCGASFYILFSFVIAKSRKDDIYELLCNIYRKYANKKETR